LGIRPEHLQVDRTGDTCTVDLTEALGGVSYSYLLTANGDKLIVEERDDERSKQGARIGIAFPTERAMLFDSETGERLR
jgi:lactose/L-arabinose transport system ATP-binding protein